MCIPRVFELRQEWVAAKGPSGFADWPRPFVFRALHLDGRRLTRAQKFYFDLILFEPPAQRLPYFVLVFREMANAGLGPTRGCATLSRVDDLATESILYDGHYLKNQEFLGCTFSFALSAPPIGRITVEFLTPTELKSEGAVVLQPEFSVLLARLRDRISNLRGLYQGGALEIDFGTLRREAEKIRIVRSNLRQVQAERLSSRTGQRHPLGGLVGDVEYAGELSSFLPFLRAGQWTGVGRQTVWGKGVLKVRGEGT